VLQDEAQPGHEIERALALLRSGQVVGLPTETVYGLAADALSEAAVLRIFELKRRPADVPLSLLIASADSLDALAIAIPDSAWSLAERFWPGPLTIVLKKRHHIPDVVTAARGTVGLRVPAHPLTLELLRRFGAALACTSANLHGQPSLSSADAVLASFGGQLELVLDGGPSSIGIESTVIDLSEEPGVLLRQGALAAAEIEDVLGTPLLVPGETC
jgi:L-threonylcarbamoyladenylate synthase